MTCPSRQPGSSRAVAGTWCQPPPGMEVAKPHLHSSLLQVLDQTFPHDEPGGEGGAKVRMRGTEEKGGGRSVWGHSTQPSRPPHHLVTTAVSLFSPEQENGK